MRKRRQGRLHPHLDGLEGAQGDIGQELGRGGSTEVDDSLGGVGEEPLAIEVLEDLVKTVLAGALEGVADEGGGPAEEDAAHALFGEDAAPGLDVGGVDLGVDLAAAFYLLSK